ncbi:hypothetical protein QBC33DRAFT_515930 [Phialemonium atrogriseum]|uniref:F-box domain-containing protein n=1 Tax=Phialemonium atrogriseum TaxID=1093897 RepID=A0AAJ0C0R1_9PEZI|nr:uncharacterized protein QBC33DRAFT_515930 [Phialemonium atrogriseum]KAK1766609.1 hypothetical protein QBC33DRAFT_515930 [Phialemonium atrogriseum]
MSRLETLPFELHIMVLEECTPQALLALISASPVSLYIYSDNRERVLHSIRDVSKLTLEDPAAILAQSIVRLRLYHKRSIAWLSWLATWNLLPRLTASSHDFNRISPRHSPACPASVASDPPGPIWRELGHFRHKEPAADTCKFYDLTIGGWSKKTATVDT